MEHAARWLRGIACAAMVAAGACGEDEDRYSSGVSGSTPLVALSSEEFRKLCTTRHEYLRQASALVGQQDCRAQGAFTAILSGPRTDGEVKSACQDGYDQCTDRQRYAPTEGTSGPMAPPPQCARPAANCTATVAEFERCVSATGAAARRSLQAIPSCDKVTLKWIADYGGETERKPEPCLALGAKCPDDAAAGSGSPP